MLMNLFSSFNPASSFIQFNWITILMIVIIFPSSFFLKQNRLMLFLKLFIKNLLKEMKPFTKTLSGMNLILSLFISIFFINLMSLFPYIFTPSAHMSITLSMSLPLWLMTMIYGWSTNTKFMFSHLTPQSTPSPLIPLMVIIETVSLLIRPFTLSIRLTTNMITGHLLLTLLNSMMISISKINSLFMISIQLILILLETAVAFIQAYIFSTLLILYASEINYDS